MQTVRLVSSRRALSRNCRSHEKKVFDELLSFSITDNVGIMSADLEHFAARKRLFFAAIRQLVCLPNLTESYERISINCTG